MNLLDRVFSEPELRDAPPVLVDVGAAGGVHRIWRRIARYSIGVGFEPDAREAAPLDTAQRMFRRWVLCPHLAMPAVTLDGTATLHLTRSPQCSSALRPKAAPLKDWAFADFFDVQESRSCPANTLAGALTANGLGHIDWLKCDTQGLDLQLYQSLPAAWRERLLAVEFEPGLIDAYEGEDRVAAVLAALAREPFWLAGFEVGGTPRARPELLTRQLGANAARWVRRLAPSAPAWANLRFLREVGVATEGLDRRAYLLSWVFAILGEQPGQALTIATLGAERFRGNIFHALIQESTRTLRWAMLRRLPAVLLRRLRRG